MALASAEVLEAMEYICNFRALPCRNWDWKSFKSAEATALTGSKFRKPRNPHRVLPAVHVSAVPEY